MAITATPANSLFYRLGKKEVDFSADTFKLILMNTGFSFTPATHKKYADVESSELTTASGYTKGGITLQDTAFTADDTNNKAVFVANTAVSFMVTDSAVSFQNALLIDDTHGDKVVIACYNYGEVQSVSPGFPANMGIVKLEIKAAV